MLQNISTKMIRDDGQSFLHRRIVVSLAKNIVNYLVVVYLEIFGEFF